MVTLMIDEHLRLVLEPAEGRGVDDPVPVALELAAGRGNRLGEEPPAAPPGIAGVWGSPSLAKGPHKHPRVEALSGRTYLALNSLCKNYVLTRTGSAHDRYHPDRARGPPHQRDHGHGAGRFPPENQRQRRRLLGIPVRLRRGPDPAGRRSR